VVPRSIANEIEECEQRFFRWLEEEHQRLAQQIESRNGATQVRQGFAAQEAAPIEEGDTA